MRLIKKIEVSYLRSLYKFSFDKVGDLNVVFGRNDSGKSNFLRALNLFFNEETDPYQDFDFKLDMSDPRKAEARSAKGKQFIAIKITFNVPENYVSALGAEIAVKKQWNRDGYITQSVHPALEGAGKVARLTRFLNDIDFTYIPAIKDLSVYADLVERMYGAAAETEELQSATTNFVDAIGGRTTSLTEQLSEIFGSNTRLAPPAEMQTLFRNLDFAHGTEGHSLFRQKGDGIKARHLPELLRFINENEARKKLYLWGFEEPENSLDLGAADEEARRLLGFSERQDTQVFVTSHSPAFYLSQSTTSAQIRRVFITKQEASSEGGMSPSNAAATIDTLAEAEAKMERAGLLQLPFVISKMDAQQKALQAYQSEAEALRKKLKDLAFPTLFVEGSHDVKLFQDAFVRLDIQDKISVKELGGTPKSAEELLGALMKQGGISTEAPNLFLFDNDKAGRGAFRKLCKDAPSGTPSKHQPNSFAWVLQPSEEFRKFQKNHKIKPDQVFFTAEFLLPTCQTIPLLSQLMNDIGLKKFKDWSAVINGDYWPSLGQSKCSELASADRESIEWFFSRGVPSSLKGRFANEAAEKNISMADVDTHAETIASCLGVL